MAVYHDILRMLVVNDLGLMSALQTTENGASDLSPLDARSRSIARLAATIAHDGSVQTFSWTIGDALERGVTPDEIIGVMLAIAPLVGGARIVNTAPKVALALDYDLDQALEDPGS